jgi:hypothetical protein
VGYVCWLLVKYYQSYVILRQHYLMGGEKQINEWHQQFLDNRAAEAGDSSKPTSRTRSRRNILGEINRVFNPNVQASSPPTYAPTYAPVSAAGQIRAAQAKYLCAATAIHPL